MFKVFFIVSAMALTLSCRENDLSRMDRSVRNAPKYEAALQDSLGRLKTALAEETSDTEKWPFAEALYDIYSHYQLDSCLHYAALMTELAGEAPDRQVIATSALARAVFSLGDFSRAEEIYESISSGELPPHEEAAKVYYTVGSWIYRSLGRVEKMEAAEERILETGDDFIEAVKLKYERLCEEGRYEDASALVRNFMRKKLTLSEYARSNYFLAQISHKTLDEGNEIHYLVLSACADMEAAVKNYNSLYELAIVLYGKGDLERAVRYMQKNLDDALFSSSSRRLMRSARSELLFSEALQKFQASRRAAVSGVLLLMVIVAIVLILTTLRLRRTARHLESANRKINDLSSIKDGFLAQYMELSAGYIGEVDETKRQLRRTLKKDGPEALAALLRTASYADSEYVNFYRNFDETFLGIYPDFVEKVNSLMKADRQFETDGKQLNTALRILALIRLGIDGRTRIAKILNIGISTVYTYHSHFLRDAIQLEKPFDEQIRNL